jgi:hypothetical protein
VRWFLSGSENDPLLDIYEYVDELLGRYLDQPKKMFQSKLSRDRERERERKNGSILLLIIGTASRKGQFYCLEAICTTHLLLRLCEVLFFMSLLILMLRTFPIEVATSVYLFYCCQ